MRKIYCLLDPLTHEIRYVGVTSKSLSERLKGHIKSSKPYSSGRSTYKAKWIRSLRQSPLIELVQEVPEGSWQQAEVFWISYFKQLGCRLTNTTIGGDGVPFTDDVKDKHRKAIKDALADPDLREKFSFSAKERYARMSQEEREGIAARARTGCSSNSFAKIHEQTRKKYRFVDPEGNVYIALGLNKFCKEHKLNQAYICKVIRGDKESYRGWTCQKI